MAISSEDVEAIKEELREELREELKEELREEFSSPGRSRRDVLKMGGAALGGAALGSVGGAAGAVGAGDEFLDVGSVTANTYRVAENWYGGPAGARSELVSELGAADTGARYGADDTGRWFYWNGSAWVDLDPESVNGVGFPAGTTVSDIDSALDQYNTVFLEPGATYTNDGTETITHTAGDGYKQVFAFDAQIQVRTSSPGTYHPTITVADTWEDADWIQWYGGYFTGTDTLGEVAFDISDSVWVTIHAHQFENMECPVVAYNEDLWCEYLDLQYRSRDNEIALALLGQDANTNAVSTAPAGSTLRTVDNSAGTGTWSFRNIRTWLDIRTRETANSDLTNQYGIYADEAKTYAAFIEATVSGDTGAVGFYQGANFNPSGSSVRFHYETPGSRSGGEGIVIDNLERGWSDAHIRISGSAGITNNTSNPFIYWDSSLTDGGAIVGPRLMIDGDPLLQFVDGQGGTPTVVWKGTGDGVRLKVSNTGVSAFPAIEIGTNGAGLWVDGATGELMAVDESGVDTQLT